MAYLPHLKGKMFKRLLPSTYREVFLCSWYSYARWCSICSSSWASVWLGKHQIGELEPSELVLTLIIADLASVPMQDNGIPLLSGLIPIVVLLALSSIISVLCTRSIAFRALLCGKPPSSWKTAW